VASACVVPEKYRKEIDSKCFKFIWNNKPDKVKRNTVVGKLAGICLAYLLTVILSKFCENTNHFCSNFAKYLHGITFQLTN
jgi:hypothetical protein